MTTKTLRLPDELASAIRAVGEAEQIEESAAMRKLLRMGFELYTARLYRDGRITLRQAARRLHRPRSETLEFFQQLGIKGNVSAEDPLASLRSLGL
jgi:hypothetical protein